MNAKELAKQLNGSEYPLSIPDQLAEQAKAAGLVVVYGQSDDLMEFRGAVRDEFDCYGGGTAYVDSVGVLRDREQIENDDELKQYFERKPKAKAIEALWCAEEDYSWTYKTAIPHETFEIVEDGEPYCRGIVFALADVSEQQSQTESAEMALLDAFDKAMDMRPHLLIEIGYSRPTDWMVHIWDATGVGIKEAPKIICTQDTSREEACRMAAEQLREKFGI